MSKPYEGLERFKRYKHTRMSKEKKDDGSWEIRFFLFTIFIVSIAVSFWLISNIYERKQKIKECYAHGGMIGEYTNCFIPK